MIACRLGVVAAAAEACIQEFKSMKLLTAYTRSSFMQICSSAPLALKLNRLMALHLITDGMELLSCLYIITMSFNAIKTSSPLNY